MVAEERAGNNFPEFLAIEPKLWQGLPTLPTAPTGGLQSQTP